MAKSNLHAGQFNLRGKKEIVLGCKCCTARDLRDDIERKRIEREIREDAA